MTTINFNNQIEIKNLANPECKKNYTENLMYNFWENNVSVNSEFITCNGHKIVVLSRGIRNNNSGPDFSNAVLLINNELKIGSIEFHLKQEDWFAHKHDQDPAYENVILHVLKIKPQSVFNIPTVLIDTITHEYKSKVSNPTYQLDNYLLDNQTIINLAWERLFNRAENILKNYNPNSISPKDFIKHNFLKLLFDCLGYSQNRYPMRLFADKLLNDRFTNVIKKIVDYESGEQKQNILLNVFLKNSDIPFYKIENELSKFGLTYSENNFTTSCQNLNLDFSENSINFNSNITIKDWVYSVRPANSPIIRIVAASKLLYKIEFENLIKNIFLELIATRNSKMLEKYFCCSLNKTKILGSSRINEIIINCVFPVGLAAGLLVNNHDLIQSICLAYKNSISLQSNKVIRIIENKFFEGKEIKGAFRQQGAIEFYQKFYSMR